MFCKGYNEIGLNSEGKKYLLLDLLTNDETEIAEYFPDGEEPDIETLKKEVTNFPQYDNIVVAPGTKIYVVETGETQVVGE